MRLFRKRVDGGPTIHSGCARHPAQAAIGACARCHHNVCESCQVVTAKHTLCVDCAMVLGGVRSKRR